MSAPQTTPFELVKQGFRSLNEVDMLKHCIGVSDTMCTPKADDSPTLAVARQLAAHTILITLDCEHYTLNSSEMTEIGIAILKRQEVVGFTTDGEEGDHGENILQKSKHYFLRLREVRNSNSNHVQAQCQHLYRKHISSPPTPAPSAPKATTSESNAS
jgi:hypothetical protein